MTLRIVTFAAPWRCCSLGRCRRPWFPGLPGLVQPAQCRRDPGSSSRNRWTNCTANAVGNGAATRSSTALPSAARYRPATGRPAHSPPGARLVPHDVVGQAPQILHEHDPKRDRDRPELADRQWLHPLIGAQESGTASADRNGCRYGRQTPRTGRTRAGILERPVGQFRELAVKARRQIDPDGANLLLPRENCRSANPRRE